MLRYMARVPLGWGERRTCVSRPDAPDSRDSCGCGLVSHRFVRIAQRRTSRHDERTHEPGGSEPATMADVAGKAPRLESRSLARVLQGPHGGEVDPLRGLGSRGAVL